MERVSSPLRRHILVLAVYLVLALILTYPLILRPHTHVPGDGIDDPALAWNLWWVKFSLVDHLSNPFDCDWMFYPLGINLAFYTLTILNGLLSVPLQGTIGLIASSNGLLWMSFVFGAYGTYLLAEYVRCATRRDHTDRAESALLREWVRQSILPSLLAGAVYGFSSSKLFYAGLGQFNIASSQWIPFAVLFMLRLGRGRNTRDALLASLFLVLQAYAELTFASFLVLFLGLWVLYKLVAALLQTVLHRHAGAPANAFWPAIRFLVRDVVIVGAVFALAISPFLLNMLPDLLSQGNLLTRGGGFEDVFSADLLGYLVPTIHHPLVGDAVAQLPFAKDKGQHIFLGYVVLALAVFGAWRSRRSDVARFWTLAAIVFFALTLGPTLRVGGVDTGIPGPFPLVARIPLFEGNRYPSRYSVMLVLSCAVLVAVGSEHLIRAIAGRSEAHNESANRRRSTRYPAMLIVVGLLAVVVLEQLSLPLPLSDLRTPSEYDSIVTSDEPYTVLDLPLGWRNGARVLGQQDEMIMFVQWYQTSHRQRILGGNTSRNPEFKFQYFAEAPVISSIIALENGRQPPQEVIEQDRLDAAEVLGYLGVRYVSLHQPPVSQELLEYVEHNLPVRQIARGTTMRLYDVDAPRVTDSRIVPPSYMGRLRMAEGWSPIDDSLDGEAVVWAQQESVGVMPRLSGDETTLRLRCWSPATDQVLAISVNGRAADSVLLDRGWNRIAVPLPANSVTGGVNDLHLHFGSMYEGAAAAAAAAAETCDTPAAADVWSLVVQSAGMDSGGNDLGHIHLNGVDLSLNQRGYNMVALGSQGALLLADSFDTHLDSGASGRMAAAIGQLPPGALVGIAAADEASMMLSDEAVRALSAIGATGDLRGRFRSGHAIIGSKGAHPGSALEDMGDLMPVDVHCGLGVTRPTVALAVAEMSFDSGG